MNKLGKKPRRESLAPISDPEIVIGLVGPVGCDLSEVESCLRTELKRVNYSTDVIRLRDLLHQIPKYKRLPLSPVFERYTSHMDAGTELRETLKAGDALAKLAIGQMRRVRNSKKGRKKPWPNHCFILHSLKHPAEIELLRRVYGRAFFVISVYTPRKIRVDNLATKIAVSLHRSEKDSYRAKAESLIFRDEAELEKDLGQSVGKAFPKADFFIYAVESRRTHSQISRFVNLLFGDITGTPSKDEFAMFHAKAASLRSADLARQVGAVLVTGDGQLLASGCNDAPAFGGGLYWDGDNDNRDIRIGFDISDKIRREALAEIIDKLKAEKWLSKDVSERSVDELVNEAVGKVTRPFMKGTRLMGVIEFGRSVHAEMACLTDAARRGLSVDKSTLFTTTFPCHICTRHIIAAGVRRVVYVEPYPKSLAKDLYDDSVAIDPQDKIDNKVIFEPFFGISPRRFLEFFEFEERKDNSGQLKKWTPKLRFERLIESYLWVEANVVESMVKSLVGVGLIADS